MKVLYTDAGTSNNGKKGMQRTRVALHDGENIIFEKEIGDYSNNEGELTGIVFAIKEGADVIKTDSKIAMTWVIKGWQKYHEKRLIKGKLTIRHKKMISLANSIYLLSGSPRIEWIPREENKAGWYLEESYGI